MKINILYSQDIVENRSRKSRRLGTLLISGF
jgi:hypothetical protein